MNIKYSKQKKEIREDPVLDNLIKSKEFLQKHSNSVVGTIIAAIVIFGIITGFNYFKKSQQARAREDFGKAMIAYNEQKYVDAIDQFRMTAENYKGTVTGALSAYMLGSVLNQQGRYEEAITWYESALKNRAIGFIGAQAYEGLAASYEMLKDTATALENLEKALTDDRIEFRRNAIRWKIALLNRKIDVARTKKLCEEIIADTLAQDYKLNAEYLMATLQDGNS